MTKLKSPNIEFEHFFSQWRGIIISRRFRRMWVPLSLLSNLFLCIVGIIYNQYTSLYGYGSTIIIVLITFACDQIIRSSTQFKVSHLIPFITPIPCCIFSIISFYNDDYKSENLLKFILFCASHSTVTCLTFENNWIMVLLSSVCYFLLSCGVSVVQSTASDMKFDMNASSSLAVLFVVSIAFIFHSKSCENRNRRLLKAACEILEKSGLAKSFFSLTGDSDIDQNSSDEEGSLEGDVGDEHKNSNQRKLNESHANGPGNKNGLNRKVVTSSTLRNIFNQTNNNISKDNNADVLSMMEHGGADLSPLTSPRSSTAYNTERINNGGDEDIIWASKSSGKLQKKQKMLSNNNTETKVNSVHITASSPDVDNSPTSPRSPRNGNCNSNNTNIAIESSEIQVLLDSLIPVPETGKNTCGNSSERRTGKRSTNDKYSKWMQNGRDFLISLVNPRKKKEKRYKDIKKKENNVMKMLIMDSKDNFNQISRNQSSLKQTEANIQQMSSPKLSNSSISSGFKKKASFDSNFEGVESTSIIPDSMDFLTKSTVQTQYPSSNNKSIQIGSKRGESGKSFNQQVKFALNDIILNSLRKEDINPIKNEDANSDLTPEHNLQIASSSANQIVSSSFNHTQGDSSSRMFSLSNTSKSTRGPPPFFLSPPSSSNSSSPHSPSNIERFSSGNFDNNHHQSQGLSKEGNNHDAAPNTSALNTSGASLNASGNSSRRLFTAVLPRSHSRLRFSNRRPPRLALGSAPITKRVIGSQANGRKHDHAAEDACQVPIPVLSPSATHHSLLDESYLSEDGCPSSLSPSPELDPFHREKDVNDGLRSALAAIRIRQKISSNLEETSNIKISPNNMEHLPTKVFSGPPPLNSPLNKNGDCMSPQPSPALIDSSNKVRQASPRPPRSPSSPSIKIIPPKEEGREGWSYESPTVTSLKLNR